MVETTESLRERALAAWQERKQELQVEAERRDTEQKLRAVRTATSWALKALDVSDVLSIGEQAEAARLAGIEAHDPRELFPGTWTVDIVVDHITLRYTGENNWSPEDRFELVGQCPDCGGEVIFGYRISSLVALGIALDEQMHDPKQGHTCPAPEDVDDHGEPMVEFAPTIVETSQDPAHVLMTALQGYIHAAVRAEVMGTRLEAKRDAENREEPF